MTATVLNIRQFSELRCPSCGASTDAKCSCGIPYVPAVQRAAKAVAKNPEKSDRAIAAEIGVSAPTVGKARKITVSDLTVERRTGLDGKVRRMPTRKKPQDAWGGAQAFEEGPVAWKNRAKDAAEQAAYAPIETCPTTPSMRKLVKAVVKKWTTVLTHIEKEIENGRP